MDSPCRCDYLWLSEPPYDDASGTPFCGHFPAAASPPIFRSQTRTLVLALLFSQPHQHAFTLEYSSERKYATVFVIQDLFNSFIYCETILGVYQCVH